MRHTTNANDLSALLNALNTLAAAGSRIGDTSAGHAGESWVARISKERWTGEKGLAIASAVVGIGAILYGARKLVGHDKSEGKTR